MQIYIYVNNLILIIVVQPFPNIINYFVVIALTFSMLPPNSKSHLKYFIGYVQN